MPERLEAVARPWTAATHAKAPPLSQPHRPFFRWGLCLLTLASLWWCLALLARWQGWPVRWALSPGLGHGLLFGLGAMPQFISGFLLTAGPRWLRVAPTAPSALRPPLMLACLGWALVLPGLHLAAPLAGMGLLLSALSWAACWRLAARMLAASEVPDRLHLCCLLGAWSIGILSMALMGVALMAAHEPAARQALQVALWWSLLPIFLTALHRMVPMFAEPGAWLQVVGRLPAPGHALLWAGLLACAWGGAWQLMPPAVLPGWAWALKAGLEGGVALLLLAQAWSWRGMAKLPLLAMMLCGGLWLALGAGLSALSAALQALGHQGLGLAPLHAVLAGGLSSLMMAQVSRVASAHAGRPLAVDRPLAGLFLLLQVAVLMRVSIAVWEAARASAGALPASWLALAALLWALAATGWAWRLQRWVRTGAAAV